MPEQRLFTSKSGMCFTSNSDTTHCIITCRFTMKVVQMLTVLRPERRLQGFMLIFAFNPAEPTPITVCSRKTSQQGLTPCKSSADQVHEGSVY